MSDISRGASGRWFGWGDAYPQRMRIKGTWPGAITLRSGWAKASARPWNDTVPDASLRLERGPAEFLRECVDELGAFGVPRVLSPPTDASTRQVWLAAGFSDHLALDLHEHHPIRSGPVPPGVVPVGDTDWDRLVEIDDAAFSPQWRMGHLGLIEARDATPRGQTWVVGDDTGVQGFAIVGLALTTGYLQRLAVDPGAARRGLGRSLVRATLAWVAGQGGTRVVLNTQPDNVAAAALYRSEGFEVTPGALSVLMKDC